MPGQNDRSGTRARYLRAIWSLTESSDVPVTVTGLARALRFVPGSVSEQVKRLADHGLVDHERYKSIALTPAGRIEAMRSVRANRLLRCFLYDVLHLPWSELATNADALEASSSPRFLQRIEAALNRPSHDPYGQPIPTSNGHVETPADTPLRALVRAHPTSVTLTRIADAPLETLLFLDQRNLHPGTRLQIRGRAEEPDTVLVRTADWQGTLLSAGTGALHGSPQTEAEHPQHQSAAKDT